MRNLLLLLWRGGREKEEELECNKIRRGTIIETKDKKTPDDYY